MPVTSRRVIGQIGDQFRRAVSSYAEANRLLVLNLPPAVP
jgi:hypothetical protein